MAAFSYNGWLRGCGYNCFDDFEWLPSAMGCGYNGFDDFEWLASANGFDDFEWLPSATMAGCEAVAAIALMTLNGCLQLQWLAARLRLQLL
jgi:hypothetical protein